MWLNTSGVDVPEVFSLGREPKAALGTPCDRIQPAESGGGKEPLEQGWGGCDGRVKKEEKKPWKQNRKGESEDLMGKEPMGEQL